MPGNALRADSNADGRIPAVKNDRASILLLNRRRLPKRIAKCGADSCRALGVLREAYPHLFPSAEGSDGVDDGLERSFERLLDALHRESRGGGERIRESDDVALLDDSLIIDGKSIVAAMEVLRKARDVPAAVRLLGSSAEAASRNRRLRRELARVGGNERLLSLEDDNDKNELRRVYKSSISLLGSVGQRREGSNPARLVLHLLRHHMPNVAHIRPGSEMYHAAINALGKLGEFDAILDLLREMERSRESHMQAEAGDGTAPPIDRMAYQTAISSLARHGHCREATRLFDRMQRKGFEGPDVNICNELLIGIAKEAGNNVANAARDEGASDPSEPWHKVALRIMRTMEASDVKPTAQTVNSIISGRCPLLPCAFVSLSSIAST